MLVAAVLAAALGGCAGSPDPLEPPETPAAGAVTVGPDGVQSITLTSGDDYRFVPSAFTVAPGQVSLTLDNAATQLTHSLGFPPASNPGEVTESIPVLAPTEVATIEFSVSTPGEYAFICSFHEALGHTGVMTVAE